MSEDPLGFAAGDANLNRYVGNDPGNKVDPSGLRTREDVDELVAFDKAMKDLLRRGLAHGWLGASGTYEYVLVTDVLGQNITSIIYRVEERDVGYGRYITASAPAFGRYTYYRRVTVYTPVYAVNRNIDHLYGQNPLAVVKRLRSPRSVRLLFAQARAKQDASVARTVQAVTEFLHALAPLATAIDEWERDCKISAAISLVGDAATLLSL